MVRLPGMSKVALAAAGVDSRRTPPAFAPQTFRQWFDGSRPGRAAPGMESLGVV